MKELLINYEKINQLLTQEFSGQAIQLIDQNEEIIKQIQVLDETSSHESEEEVKQIKQQLLQQNEQIIKKIQKLKEKKKPELINMSQKVQASQAYNNMRRNLY